MRRSTVGEVSTTEQCAPVELATASSPRASLWVRSPAWDVFWIQSAVWLVPIVLWLARGLDDPDEGVLDVFYCGLTALFWIGHRVGSTYLAYATEAYRPLLRAQPVRFVVMPALVTLGCFALLLPPDAALPWSRAERIVALAIADYLGNTYHFAAQHFGALSLYRLRAGRGGRDRVRSLDRWFALGAGGVLVVVADVLAGAIAYHDLWVDRWLLPSWIHATQDPIRGGALLVLTVATIVMLGAELRAARRSVPRVLYVLGTAAMVAIALQPRSPFLFLVVWTAQHWMLATGLGSRSASAEPVPMRGPVRRALHALNVRPWAVALLLVALSCVLLPVFEVEANWQGDSAYYGDWIFGALAASLRTSSWVPALVALGFATGFNHYLLDRAVYRFSDPPVRAAARGLLAPRKPGFAHMAE